MIYVPASTVEAWRALLANPDKQWVTGYSAKALAHCWQGTVDFPATVRRVLDQSPALRQAEMLAGFVEHGVPLPPQGRHPSQNDLFVFARLGTGRLATIAVEGKVSEPFGNLISEWISASDSPGKRERLAFICDLLGLSTSSVDNIRYQLLHRTASTMVEAKRWAATHAVLLVHSFSQTNQWFDDYAAFARLLGVAAPAVDTVSEVGERHGIRLHVAWVKGDEKYLRV